MNWDEVVATGRELPGMEVSTSYGTPALKVRGKLVARLIEDGESVVLLGVPSDERDMLLEAAPAIFHTTPHYRGHPMVLARLARLDEARLRPFLVRRWRETAPKRVVARYDEAASGGG